MFHVGRIEVEEVVGQIAVRVNHPHAKTGLDVLKNQVSQEGRFTRPAFPIT